MTVVYLGAYWQQQPLTLERYIETTRWFLWELGQFHPVFTRLSEIGDKPNAKVAILEDGSNLASLALERAWNKKAPSHVYTNLDNHKKPTLQTVSDTGFYLHFQNDGRHKVKRLGTYVIISAGSNSPYVGNCVTLDLPVAQYPEFAQVDFVSRLYRIVEKYWNPEEGLVASESFRGLTYSRKPTTISAIGWLTYITDKELLAGLDPGVRQIPCANGVLVVTSEEFSSVENPEHVAQAMKLRDVLQKPLAA